MAWCCFIHLGEPLPAGGDPAAQAGRDSSCLSSALGPSVPHGGCSSSLNLGVKAKWNRAQHSEPYQEWGPRS